MKKRAQDNIQHVVKKKKNIRKGTTSQEKYKVKKYDLARLKKIKVSVTDEGAPSPTADESTDWYSLLHEVRRSSIQ